MGEGEMELKEEGCLGFRQSRGGKEDVLGERLKTGEYHHRAVFDYLSYSGDELGRIHRENVAICIRRSLFLKNDSCQMP